MGEIWWLQVSNARRLIFSVLDVLKTGKSVTACLPVNLPYPNTFEEVIKRQLMYNFPNMELVKIDLAQEDITEVGMYMLKKYCKEAKRVRYRGGKSIAAFLAESKDIVFHSRYFWVKNILDDKISEWLDFINDYNKNLADGLSPAFFILETHNEDILKQTKGAVVGISFDAAISDYDKYAFCTSIAAENSCKLSIRDYLGQLVASVTGEDVELCAECVAKSKEFLEDPIGTIEDIVATRTRSNGMDFDFTLEKEKMEEKVWTAQIRTVFPVVERARIKFIKTYFAQLNDVVLRKSIRVGSEIAETPYDLELGTMIYLAGQNMLSMPRADYEKLDMYRNARNDMAHQTVMDFNRVDRILSTKIY